MISATDSPFCASTSLLSSTNFQPIFFAYDSTEIDSAGQQSLNANAELMKKYGTWVITIEGHADERGTAEYNLALGERRAVATRSCCWAVCCWLTAKPAAISAAHSSTESTVMARLRRERSRRHRGGG